MRTAEINRTTAETAITLRLCLDGTGASQVQSGVGFLDHMLTLFAKHSRFDLTLTCCRATPKSTTTTASRTSALSWARRCAKRWATSAASAATAAASCPWTKRSFSCAADLSGRGCLRLQAQTSNGKGRDI